MFLELLRKIPAMPRPLPEPQNATHLPLVSGLWRELWIRIQIRIRICTEAEAGNSRNMQLQLVCGSSKIVFA